MSEVASGSVVGAVAGVVVGGALTWLAVGPAVISFGWGAMGGALFGMGPWWALVIISGGVSAAGLASLPGLGVVCHAPTGPSAFGYLMVGVCLSRSRTWSGMTFWRNVACISVCASSVLAGAMFASASGSAQLVTWFCCMSGGVVVSCHSLAP